MKYDIFIDESCHLEHDKMPVMCIGYIKVPQKDYGDLLVKIEEIKLKHKTRIEVKWNKFSKSRFSLFKDLADLFFDSNLEFRCILVKYKKYLNHEDFNQGSHDNFYYKMVYYLLRPNIPDDEFRVFLDIKDTRGKEKLNKIEEIFKNYHRGKSPFIHFQHLRSHDNAFFQIIDLFIGAVTYKSRKNTFDKPNAQKLEFIKYLEEKSGYDLDESTPPWESKFNIFNHQPKRRKYGPR